MIVSVRDARSSERDRLWIQGVYRDYLDDLAPLNATGLFPALGEVGHREPDQIARWFGDRNAFPLVIVQGREPVGFAMVARGSALPGQPQSIIGWRSFSSRAPCAGSASGARPCS